MQVLPSPPLVPSSMEGGNMMTTQALQTLANPAAAGSAPVTPLPAGLSGENLPAPALGPRRPGIMQAGHYGAAGLHDAGARPAEGGVDAAPWPAGDQDISTGPWHKTPGF